MSPKAKADIRRQVEAATLAKLERVGIDAFRKEPIVALFRDAGVGKSSIYRWIDAVIASGRAGRHLAEKVTEAVAEIEARGADPAAEAAAEVGARLPRVPSVKRIAEAGGTVAVVDQIGKSIRLAERIIAECTAPDGSIRMKKSALAASEHLRRCLETAIKLADAMREISRLDEFHRAVVDCIGRLAPEVAEELRQDLHRLETRWNAGT